MERLTKESLKNSYVLNPQPNIPSVIVEGMIYNKLGKLEDIEEELGCPLEVIEKALSNGIYIACSEGLCVVYRYGKMLTVNQYLSVWIKDYKKTWWLKEDRSK